MLKPKHVLEVLLGNDPEANDPGATDTEMAALEDHTETPFEIQTLQKDMSQSAERAISPCEKMETQENDPDLTKACDCQTESIMKLKEIKRKLEVVQERFQDSVNPKVKKSDTLIITSISTRFLHEDVVEFVHATP